MPQGHSQAPWHLQNLLLGLMTSSHCPAKLALVKAQQHIRHTTECLRFSEQTWMSTGCGASKRLPGSNDQMSDMHLDYGKNVLWFYFHATKASSPVTLANLAWQLLVLVALPSTIPGQPFKI